jgi:cell wall-associated NlpC family hydrolase
VAVIASIVVVAGLVALAVAATVSAVQRQTHDTTLSSGQAMARAVPATYRPVAYTRAPTELARMGNWTPDRGRTIATRALSWLSWPYSFGAGDGKGPTFGHAVDKDSRNDGHVIGFDCSGLTLYALAPWLHPDHSAAAQYTEVGSFHPTLDTLQPGDMVFWTPDGTIGHIGHVAVYIGNGQVVQAPRSGSVIQVTPIYNVEPGVMGATRPLT